MRNPNNILIKCIGLLVLLAFLLPGTSLQAKRKKLSPDMQEFYNYTRHIFTKNEKKIFLNLPNREKRLEFVKHFWKIRDPNPYSEGNEFKEEMEDRYEYVRKYLKEGPVPGYKTDRGRIYILLGKPWQTGTEYPNAPPFSIIYWYYEDSDIFVRFIDSKGHGVHDMDLFNISMKLLNVLEKRQNYIFNKAASQFETKKLSFNVQYDNAENKLGFRIDPKHVHFEPANEEALKKEGIEKPAGEAMMAKFKIDIMYYAGNDVFSSISEVRTVVVNKKYLLEGDSKLVVDFPLTFKLPKGKLKLDVIVTDFLGNAGHRKLTTIHYK
ncbi:MAG: GWxTD domain-containing protein [bacterium]|nr:GWxTD domain-containing protein [bacterium]